MKIITKQIASLVLVSLSANAFAYTATVNPQVTDSVTQSNTKVIGEAPAVAMGSLYTQTMTALQRTAMTNDLQAINLAIPAAKTCSANTSATLQVLCGCLQSLNNVTHSQLISDFLHQYCPKQ